MAIVSTDSFLHFTSGGTSTLKLILENGFRASICNEVMGFFRGNPKEELITAMAIPMICFCDIPPKAIARHAEYYCKNSLTGGTVICGVGMKRAWGLRANLNPVSYISGSSSFYRYNTINNDAYGLAVGQYLESNREISEEMRPLLETTILLRIHLDNGLVVSQYQPRRVLFDKLTVADYYRIDRSKTYAVYYDYLLGKSEPKPFREYLEITKQYNFYNEREWRIVPDWIDEISVFQSKLKNDAIAARVKKEKDIEFDESFADKAFHSYLLENHTYEPKNLLFSVNDISVIVVEDQKAKDEILNHFASSQKFGGMDTENLVLETLPKLIKLYSEFAELDDI